jgi:hypothetical protein
MKKLFCVFVLFATLLPLALAQRIVVSPEAIVVNPKPGFNVDVWLDRDTTGNDRPEYQVGDGIHVSVRVSESAYVYLFSVKPDGEITQILPNQYDDSGRDNYVQAGQTRVFPPSGSRYTFNIAPPRGLSKVIAVASKDRLDTRELATFHDNSGFASSNIGQEGFVKGFAIVVRPIPQNDWVTDTALYYVGDKPQTPAFATLRIDSSPRGAEVVVDGEFVGYTPASYGTRPGRHDVRLTLDGYEPFETNVQPRPGETVSVNPTLRPIVRTGTASFTSSPRGADVTVDGRYVGTTPTGSITFDQGQHTARFTLDGYEDQGVVFQVARGADRRVDATLRRAQGSLEVQANVGGALVFVDGRQVGTIASGSGRFSLDGLDPGSHELTVVAPGFRTYVTTFDVRSGRASEVRVRQSRF